MSMFKNWKYIVLSSGVIAVAAWSSYKTLRWYRTHYKHVKHMGNSPEIYVCSSWSDWSACEDIFHSAVRNSKVLGLDCEWVTVNDERHPVALLQLAPSGNVCFLIRLCHIIPQEIPKSLLEVLEDYRILKVGVNVVGDAQKLRTDYRWDVKGSLDLRYLIKGDPKYNDIVNCGLRTLASEVLHVDIVKSVKTSCSDWEADTLNSDQVTYAAEDALVALQIFQKLYPGYNDEPVFHFPGRRSLRSVKRNYRNFIDVSYKTVNNPHPENKNVNLRPLHQSRFEKLSARAKKTPIYDNCFIVAPDGEPLCACSKSKTEWYLEKGLAELVHEDPIIVRLTFEPSGRPILDNKFYIQEKKSGCVVCGNKDNIFRKSVVPHEYRKYFPPIMTRCLSHDVVSLCVTCHRLSNALDSTLRNELAKECDAPVGNGNYSKKQQNYKLKRVKGAAKALLLSDVNIPEKRKKVLEEVVRDHFGVTELSEDLMKEASSLCTEIVNENFIPHGMKVYQYMCKNGGLIAFESRWRKHFLDTMQPEFLPDMWSVDHNHERLALQVLQRKMDFDISILGITQEMFEKVKNM